MKPKQLPLIAYNQCSGMKRKEDQESDEKVISRINLTNLQKFN